MEAARIGTTVSLADVAQVSDRWAELRETVLAYGYRSVHAVPLRARESGSLAEQLQHALDSRVCIEQAKGVLAASADVDMDRAFRMLRDHARKRNLKLLTVAQGVVDRSLEIGPARERKPAQ